MKTFSTLTTAILPVFLAVAGLSAAPIPLEPVAGDIFVSTTGAVIKVNADGTQTPVAGVVLDPQGSVVDQQGNLYVADGATNSVIKFASDGTQTTVTTGLNGPKDLALDATGNLYVANSGTNSIVKIGADGTKTTLTTGVNDPSGLALDPTGNLFVSAAGTNTIVKVVPDGTKTTFVASGLNNPAGLAFDAEGNLLVADKGSDSILSIGRDGKVTTAVSSGLNSPSDVAVDALGNLLVADTGSGSILKVAPDGTITPVASGLIGAESLSQAPGLHQLLDIATRGFVQTGDHVLIGGFIVRGTPNADLGQTSILVRAIGPSIDRSAVPDPLLDPLLELHDSSGALIATNDNWKDSQQSEIEATGLAPTNDKESAIRATLADGSYTAIVRGVNNTVGVALVEVYKIQ